jgi:hypothetical protein
MPVWNEELQQWGYHYYENVNTYEWLGIRRTIMNPESFEISEARIKYGDSSWKGFEMAETRKDWEVIQENAQDRTERLKILHGWLYRVVSSTGVIALTYVPGD